MDLIKLKELLPVGTLFLFFCSSLKLVTFYYFGFKIIIVDYLEFQELITYFLDDSFQYLSKFGYIILIFIAIDYYLVHQENWTNTKADLSSISFRKAVTILVGSFIGCSILINIMTVIADIYNYSYWTFKVGQTFFFILLIIAIGYSYKFFGAGNEKYLIFAIYLIIHVSFQAKSEAGLIKEELKYQKIDITIDKKHIHSNDKYYFIGRTKKFTFYYNSIKKSTDIYPNNKITHIVDKGRNTRKINK